MLNRSKFILKRYYLFCSTKPSSMTSNNAVGMKELIRLESYIVKTGNKFFIFQSGNSFVESNIMSGRSVQNCIDSISRHINCIRMATACS